MDHPRSGTLSVTPGAAGRPAAGTGASHRVGLSIDLVALLVHRAVVPPAEQREICERRRAALRPVMEMMPLGEADPAAREATTSVPMM